ncbi:MAG: DUF87 domain-containing protein [Sphaerochaetaceae bacterium]
MNDSDRVIGRVLSVDNFRVFIKIDEGLHGSYKSGFNDIYEIARINSYLIIPVGADRVVALITRVSMKEEFELDKNPTGITLPTSARYITATMLGTIACQEGKERFIQGVYNFPSLDNPVWYVTEKDLGYIFDEKQEGNTITYESDFYLPIGTSPSFPGYKVKICPDQFFVKHAAILGNTGSGKSCTLASIIRNLFRFDYNGKVLKNAHFLIFDTNGEYKNAFLPDEDPLPSDEKLSEQNKKELHQINAYYYGGEEEVKVPYWFMDWEDFKHFLRPSEGSQAPVLNRAIGLAKKGHVCTEKNILSAPQHQDITEILQASNFVLKRMTSENFKWAPTNDLIGIGKDICNINTELGNKILELGAEEKYNNALLQTPIRKEIQELYQAECEKENLYQVTSEQNIDLPTWFNYQELCINYIDDAIRIEGKNNNKISEYISTLRLRMHSFLNDKRMAIPLMLKDTEKCNKEVLPQFIAFLLGDFNRYYLSSDSEKTPGEGNDKKNFIEEYNTNSKQKKPEQQTNQIMIVDVSQLPFEVLETVTALIGRLILEFVANFLPEERGKYPIVIVLEEAQNYIAENRDSVAKLVFERIAREGRKYGISLIVCSQRPSELSKTVLSQCNSFIIHRLQNPDDQKYVKSLVSSANADLLDQLPIIPQQHAIITGDCVRTPVLVKIDSVSPKPNSHNPEYVGQWLKDDLSIPYDTTCKRWLGKPYE